MTIAPNLTSDAAANVKGRAALRRRKAAWQIWCGADGRLSWLRLATIAFLLVPVAVAIYDYQLLGSRPARPLNDVIHRTGYWALIYLFVSLAVTPLRRIGRFNQLLDIRRMIGVGAFIYAVAHILLYVADQMFDLTKVASEIVLRLYLTIGFVALLGLTALAATSTDAMVRRLGAKRWQLLHQAIYAIAGLVLIHYFQQTKADVTVPTFMAGLFGWLIGYRLLVWWRDVRDEPPASWLLALTIAVAVLTMVCEAIGIALSFNVSPLVVLKLNFEFYFDMPEAVRPAWWVVGAGLCVIIVDLIRSRGTKGLAKPRRRAAA